jgi:hypothetical protein
MEQNQQVNIKTSEITQIDRTMSVMRYNFWTVDIQVFRFVLKNFHLALPFIVSIVVILLLIFVPLLSGYDGYILSVLYHNLSYFSFVNYALLGIILFYSIVCCSVYVFSYLYLGFLLRKKYLNIKENPTVMISRYFRLSGYILVVSFLWFIIILTIGSSRKKNLVSSIESTAKIGILSAFKLFLYTNIVRVALGDEKSNFKQTYEFVKKDAYRMLRVWFGSGLLVGSVFVCLLAILMFVEKSVITQGSIVAPAFFIGIAFIFIFRSFAEQIGMFAVYMKDRDNIDII